MLPNWLYGKSLRKLQEILNSGGQTAAGVSYSNTGSGLEATNAQTAIDEVVEGLNTKVDWNDLSEVGAVNYCKNNVTTTTTTDGTTTFTWTVNEDKSVTVSAPSYPVTLASSMYVELWKNITADECKELVGKTLKCTGCPSGGAFDKYRISLYRVGTTDGSAGTDATIEDDGDGVVFTWKNNGSGTKASIYLELRPSYVMTAPLTFKPMITPVSYNGPYVPYSMTNQKLTKKLTADASLSAAVNLSRYTSYSNMYTAPSDGYVHFLSAASGSAARTIYTYGNNTTAATDPHFTHSTSANNKAFEIFIKKGLMVYIDGLQSDDTINFYPLS